AAFPQRRKFSQTLRGNALKSPRPGAPRVGRGRGEFPPPPPGGGGGGGGGAPSPSPGSPREPPSPPRGEGQAGDPVPLTCRVIVQDNGIGFDEKYRERIFEVFQRLHGRDEYDGTGVGLAICHKIVERHGGTIVGHSKPGDGSAFVVTLPVRPAAVGLTGEPGPGAGG